MLKTEEFLINMGPQHPSTHGVLRVVLKLDGEVIKAAVPHIGYLHRSVEKIAENRTYTSFLPFTDRLDYIASMTNNWSYCLAVERLMDLFVSPRAEYIRIIMGELNRIASHLLWYGTLALDLGATTPFLYAFREREKILDLFEMVCGARLTFNYYRIGGVAKDLPSGFIEKAKKFLESFKKVFHELEDILTENVIFLNRTKDIGIISRDMAIKYGASGPTLRGSRIKWDLRKDEPYSLYNELEFDVPTGKNGDCWDRYRVRVDEMKESVKIVEQALDKIPEGEINPNIPYGFDVPEGEMYSRIESPRGELGFYIISDGTEKPYRLKIRAPSFSNLSLLPELLKETKIADVVAIIGSLDIVLGEVDR